MGLAKSMVLFILILYVQPIIGQEYSSVSGLQQISNGKLWYEYNKDHERSPTIVFEAGAMSHATYWNPVFDSISTIANTLRYDRAGLGRSSASIDSVRSAVQIAKELNELLDSLKVGRPIILVCHSIGGFYGRAFARLDSMRVKSLILIDSPCTDWESLLRNSLTIKQNTERDSILRINRNRISYFQSQEYAAADINRNYLKQTPCLNIPVYIIAGGNHVWPEDYNSDLLDTNWKKCQENLLNISSISELITVPNSGHHVFQRFSLYQFLNRIIENAE